MATPRKKPVVKKSVTKNPTSRRTPALKSARVVGLVREQRRFMETKFTEQTIYWLIIGVCVLALGYKVISLQNQINDIYDSVDASYREGAELDERLNETMRAAEKQAQTSQ